MKRVILAPILTAIIIIGGCLYTHYLDGVCDKISLQIYKAYEAPENSAQYIKTASEILEDNSKIFCIFIDQEFINDAECGMVLCHELSKLGNEDDLKGELMLLLKKIERLKQNEKFDLKRIL